MTTWTDGSRGSRSSSVAKLVAVTVNAKSTPSLSAACASVSCGVPLMAPVDVSNRSPSVVVRSGEMANVGRVPVTATVLGVGISTPVTYSAAVSV